MERLLREYPLSSAEGLALMRLAEALLRVPDAEDYGRLVACLGGGTILGGWRVTHSTPPLEPGHGCGNRDLGFFLVTAVVTLVTKGAVLYAVLIVGGTAWLVANTLLFTVAQISVPAWVCARCTALVLVVFQGAEREVTLAELELPAQAQTSLSFENGPLVVEMRYRVPVERQRHHSRTTLAEHALQDQLHALVPHGGDPKLTCYLVKAT